VPRYNVAASRWLPLYLWRRAVVAGVLYALGAVAASSGFAGVLSTCLYVPATLSVAVCCLILSLIARFEALAG